MSADNLFLERQNIQSQSFIDVIGFDKGLAPNLLANPNQEILTTTTTATKKDFSGDWK